MLRDRAVALAVVVTLAVVAIGCGDDDGGSAEPVAPAGFSRYSGNGFSLAFPNDWTRSPAGKPRGKNRLVEFLDPDTTEGLPTQIGVSRSPRPGEEITHYIQVTFGVGATVEGAEDFEIVDRRDIEVPGARSAVRLDIRYTSHALGPPVPVRQWAVIARRSDEQIFDLRLGAVADDFDEALFSKVAASFRLR